jgi:hypothetical protein
VLDHVVNSHLALTAAVYVEQQPTGEVVDAKLRLYDKVAHLQSGGCLLHGEGVDTNLYAAVWFHVLQCRSVRLQSDTRACCTVAQYLSYADTLSHLMTPAVCMLLLG